MEVGKIQPQSNYEEYDWLVPDPTQNKQGWYILIFPIVLVNLTMNVPTMEV